MDRLLITILCSSGTHPIVANLENWANDNRKLFEVDIVNSTNELKGGDILFLISCNDLVSQELRNLYKSTLVIHASNLPNGKGWSPHIWRILQGKNEITVSLIKAEDAVDSGDIIKQQSIKFEGHELYNEINDKLFQTEIELMSFAVDNFGKFKLKKQACEGETYYSKRNPEDSQLDITKTIEEQFNQMRVADPDRFPNFFYYLGYKYQITVKKIKE